MFACKLSENNMPKLHHDELWLCKGYPSRYVEKDEGEAEEKNMVLSNVEKGERKAYFENGQWGKGEENDEPIDIYKVVVNELSRYLDLFHTPY